MRVKKSLLIISTVLAATTLYAQPSKHMIIAPECLLKTAAIAYQPLASKNGLHLISADDAVVNQLAEAKHRAKQCGGFKDVTESWQHQPAARKLNAATFMADQARAKSVKAPVYKIQYQKEAENTLKDINPQNMWNNLATLTSFDDRYANSDTGVKAAQWIKDKVETIAKDTGHDDVSVYFVKTGTSYKQPSVVAKFGNGTGPGIVIGAHMDTLLSSSTKKKPGADDDGSGTVTLMETARTLLASGLKFDKPIYFVWYSAEELGLIGSQFVVADFKKKNIPVAAALQLDMTGYENSKDPTIWLMTDEQDTNKNLTAYLRELIKTYVKVPTKNSQCGYACSDHASWQEAGIPAAFPFETRMGEDDPYIHTSQDTMDFLTLEHMTDFAKLATAYAVELAEPVK